MCFDVIVLQNRISTSPMQVCRNKVNTQTRLVVPQKPILTFFKQFYDIRHRKGHQKTGKGGCRFSVTFFDTYLLLDEHFVL
jgi:hypothetical protein